MKISHELSQLIEKKLGAEILKTLSNFEYKHGDYLGIGAEDETRISYIPANAFTSFEGAYFDQELRAAKGCFVKLSKLLTLAGLENKTVSALAVKWGAPLNISYKVLKISELYELAKEHEIVSCMSSEATKVEEFYDNFPVSGLAFYEGEKFLARALLWTDVSFSGDEVPAELVDKNNLFLDRIYTTAAAGNDLKTLEGLNELCKKEGWVSKEHQNYFTVRNFLYDGVPFEADAGVESLHRYSWDTCFFPYLDTFCGVEDSGEILSNSMDAPYLAKNVDGTLDGMEDDGNYHICDYCGLRLTGEGVEGENTQIYCDAECATEAGLTRVEILDGPYGLRREAFVNLQESTLVFLQGWDAYAEMDDCEECEECGELDYTRNIYTHAGRRLCEYCRDAAEEEEAEAEAEAEEAV